MFAVSAKKQSLWHLRWFRFELQRRRKIPHAHAGNPCVFCSLCNTFTVLSLSPVCWKKDVVAPCLAKMALSDLYPDNIFFQEVSLWTWVTFVFILCQRKKVRHENC